MLVGHVPFHDETFMGTLQKHVFEQPVPPRELRPEIPENVEFLVCRMLEKEAEKRFYDMEEVIRALDLIGDDGEVHAPYTGGRWKIIFFWSLLFSLLALAAAAFWWASTAEGKERSAPHARDDSRCAPAETP
jgi:hypothetical protein